MVGHYDRGGCWRDKEAPSLLADEAILSDLSKATSLISISMQFVCCGLDRSRSHHQVLDFLENSKFATMCDEVGIKFISLLVL